MDSTVSDSEHVTISEKEMRDIIHDFALLTEWIGSNSDPLSRIWLLKRFKSDTLKATYFGEVKPNGS